MEDKKNAHELALLEKQAELKRLEMKEKQQENMMNPYMNMNPYMQNMMYFNQMAFNQKPQNDTPTGPGPLPNFQNNPYFPNQSGMANSMQMMPFHWGMPQMNPMNMGMGMSMGMMGAMPPQNMMNTNAEKVNA